ncbi:MAG: hypothetical protein KC731_37180 [Myxococcales bacterium]|nr:hypothetical protein [Myxococcales bacterium]
MANEFEIVQVGQGKRHPESGHVIAHAVMPITNDVDDVEDFGEIDIFGQLGCTAMPWGKDDNGANEGFVCRNAANTDGILIGVRDDRTTDAYAELGPGETCLHATGPDFNSRVFCKEQLISLVVNDNVVFSMDAKTNRAITLSGFGCLLEMSEENGLMLVGKGGKAMIHLMENGTIWIKGDIVLLGPTPGVPASAVQVSTSPGTVSTTVFASP